MPALGAVSQKWTKVPISSFFRDKQLKRKAVQLYGTAMAQARNPELYRQFGVPDTPDGRLAMIQLHAALLLNRLMTLGEQPGSAFPKEQRQGTGAVPMGVDVQDGGPLARNFVEVFIADLDQAMRELGISDMGVPKRMKKVMAQFYAFAGNLRTSCQSENADRAIADNLAELTSGWAPAERELFKLEDAATYTCKVLDQLRTVSDHNISNADISMQSLP